jgi:hypothetical protein
MRAASASSIAETALASVVLVQAEGCDFRQIGAGDQQGAVIVGLDLDAITQHYSVPSL